MQLGPLRVDALTDEFMTRNGWNDWDKKSWTNLTGKFSCVLISDHASLVGGLVQSKRSSQPAPIPQQMVRQQPVQQQIMMSPTVVAPVVATVVVPPQPITMQVAVPPNAGPGTTLQLQTPDGRQVQVQVPVGVAPGQMFQVQV